MGEHFAHSLFQLHVQSLEHVCPPASFAYRDAQNNLLGDQEHVHRGDQHRQPARRDRRQSDG